MVKPENIFSRVAIGPTVLKLCKVQKINTNLAYGVDVGMAFASMVGTCHGLVTYNLFTLKSFLQKLAYKNNLIVTPVHTKL